MQKDPVGGAEDETQAHVGSGVVKVTEQIHSLLASFGPKLSVQLMGSPQLIGCRVCYGGTGRQGM